MSEGSNGAEVAVAEGGGPDQQQQPAARSWLDIAKSIIFQMVIFYLISSYFKGGKTPPPGEGGKDEEGNPLPPVSGTNLFHKGQELVGILIVYGYR